MTKKCRNYWPEAVYMELREHYVKVDLKWQDLLRDMERRVIWHLGRHQHNNGTSSERQLNPIRGSQWKILWRARELEIPPRSSFSVFSVCAPLTQGSATRRTLGLTRLTIEVETTSEANYWGNLLRLLFPRQCLNAHKVYETAITEKTSFSSGWVPMLIWMLEVTYCNQG
jgi:hypothetical protein